MFFSSTPRVSTPPPSYRESPGRARQDDDAYEMQNVAVVDLEAQ